MWLWLFVASAVLNLFSLLYVRWLLSSLAVINTDIENVTVLIQIQKSFKQKFNPFNRHTNTDFIKSLPITTLS